MTARKFCAAIDKTLVSVSALELPIKIKYKNIMVSASLEMKWNGNYDWKWNPKTAPSINIPSLIDDDCKRKAHHAGIIRQKNVFCSF